ncbi:acetoacetate decarboxylase family protein [Amycolatopsis sp. NPDC051758]|uniref:acetoacetate decarboxylase family protein n=1 Tax=Amycolatopsis sp. NPDC051758 TaxID=3363935 RepID=UPI0037AC0075
MILEAIASGPEVAAYPKKLGKPRLFVDSDTLVGTLDHGSIRVALADLRVLEIYLAREQG